MARTRESKLWQRIKDLRMNMHIFRIESNTINGIPDVAGCKDGRQFWLELKSNDRKDYGVSSYQLNWHHHMNSEGGNAWLLHQGLKHRDLKLLRVHGFHLKKDKPWVVELYILPDTPVNLKRVISRVAWGVTERLDT